MKRKYLSALLMGTLTVASMSTFTSCKDYDDDISNLQGQIDKLATADQLSQKVSELQALISSNQTGISSLETKLAEVKATADSKATLDQVKDILAGYATNESVTKEANEIVNAAIKALQEKDIKDLKALIETAQGKADQAVKDAADAKAEILKTLEDYALKSDVDAAQGTADDALAKANANKTAIENALKTLGTGFDEKNTVAAAIEAINGQLTAKNTGLAGLDGRLSVIEAALKSDESGDKLTNLKLKIDNIENKLKDIIGQYSTMVTDVQLYNFTTATNPGFDQELKFIQATEQANVFPGAGVADAQFTFEKGKYFAGEDSLLIRVSPVDAELTTSNISLLSSQGKELNDLIEVTDAHRYSDLLYGQNVPTRAAGVDANTGLWVVKFKAKDLGDAFKAAAETKVNNVNKYVLYSVAVKNTYTTDEAKDRRVTSEYCVNLNSDVANHAYDFAVNKTPIKNIKNRTNDYPEVTELDWNDNSKPATTVITDVNDRNRNAGKNATNADARTDAKILAVEKGGDIVIDFTKTDGATNQDFGVKGFYVTLDDKFALESAPSEINAWNSYSYENVGYKKNGTTYQPAKLFTGNKGIIKINDMGNVKGDVIGFRVYAVNYDGTLTDPDGRAFYVAVGDAKADMTIPATTVSIDMTTANSDQPEFVSPKVNVDLSKCNDFDSNDTWVVTAEDKDGKKPTEFKVKYFKADGSEVDDLSKEVTAVQFVLTEPNKFIDDETYTVSTTLKKDIILGTTAEVGTITASFKKEMPKEAPTFGYRDGFDKFEYIIPTDDYTVNAADGNGNYTNKGGEFDFRNILIVNNNQTAWNGFDLFNDAVFDFNVNNATYATENGKLVLKDAKTTSDVNYILAVNNSGANLVDNKTEHTITADFVYKNISKRYVKNPSDNKMKWMAVDYTRPSASSEKIVYCSWMKTLGYNVTSNIVEEEQLQPVREYNEETQTWETKNKLVKVKVQKTTWLNHNTVTWSTRENASTELDLANLQASVADLKLIPTSVASTVKGTNLKAFFTSNVIDLVKGTYGNVWTTSADGKQINPYFTASFANGKITLTQKNQTAIPSNVKGGLIHFTVRDCFGNLKAIQLPFVIKMPEVTARKH
mgnify:CR=1 FL=1